MSPIFLCIGAMRSGTTWLYEVLRRHPDCALPPLKELHFFEARYAPEPDHADHYALHFDHVVSLASRLAADLRGQLAARNLPAGALFEDGFLAQLALDERLTEISAFTELLRIRDIDSYVAYFETLRARAGAKIAGEMTATYADLPEAAFREIARRIEGVKFIYVMRDPVDRFWSHARFRWSREGGRDIDLARIDEVLAHELILPRSDYRQVIQKLEAAVDEKQIFYAFYERLVARDTVVEEIGALERFLGLAPVDAGTLLALVDRPENASPQVTLSRENRRLIRARLAGVYEFVERKFGALPPGWREA